MVLFFFLEKSELKELISAISSLPIENVEYARVEMNSSFGLCFGGPYPRYNRSPLHHIHTSQTWCSEFHYAEEAPLSRAHSGDMYFYR